MIQKFKKIGRVRGSLSFSGDKSISHRVLIISALAKGNSYIKNISSTEDVHSTVNCLQQLGIEIKYNKNATVITGNLSLIHI
mgnify:CR=1 FL=1